MKEEKDLLSGKRILIVDDEPDVLETLEDLLHMCDIVKASRFDEAKKLLESQSFDIALLDIMGVDGYRLLDIANEKNITAVMLTAHALSVENTEKAFKNGAASFLPKDKMMDIHTYLTDVIEAKNAGKHPWRQWLKRFGAYYKKRFGKDWVDYEAFWKEALKDKKP